MRAAAWKGYPQICEQAFEGFSGAMIFGATQMLAKQDDGQSGGVRQGITEIPFLLKKHAHGAVFGGVVIGKYSAEQSGGRAVLSRERDYQVSSEEWAEKPFTTTRHPDAELYVAVDESTEGGNPYHAEVHASARIGEALADGFGFTKILMSFGGGSTTEFELRERAKDGWIVLLVQGGFGTTDTLASDPEFTKRVNVHVVPKDAQAIRAKLSELGAFDANSTLTVPGLWSVESGLVH